MTNGLIWASAIALRDQVARGQLTCLAIVEACLARIEELDDRLHAFIFVDREGALVAARRADEAVRNGEKLGPLHGVPVALKDDLWVGGMPATAGSLIFSNFVPSHDGTVAKRLRAAGAIIIGKTNLPEFTSWPRSKSLVGGESVNPWDTGRIPGASSGGSAVAVASGMVPLAIGTDGGGSVRLPSAFCGLVGLMPTIGRVPDYGSFLCSPMSSAGPMARTVRDVALLQQVIAGFDPDVPASLNQASPDLLSDLDGSLNGLHVTWSPDFGRIAVDPNIVASALHALGMLTAAGATIKSLDGIIPHPWGSGALMQAVGEAAGKWRQPDPTSFGEIPTTGFPEAAIAATSSRLESYFSASEVMEWVQRWNHLLSPPQKLIAAHMNRDAQQPSLVELREAADRIFEHCDILCSPTTATVAPQIPHGWAYPYPDSYSGTHFTFIANATGRPAITVPCGLVDGMPAGLQIIGRVGDEATILRAARTIEKALPPLPHPAGVEGR